MSKDKAKTSVKAPKSNNIEHLIKDLNVSLQEYLAALKAVSVK